MKTRKDHLEEADQLLHRIQGNDARKQRKIATLKSAIAKHEAKLQEAKRTLAKLESTGTLKN